MKQPLLFRFGFIGNRPKDSLVIMVFILDRIMVADLKTTPTEIKAFADASKTLSALTGHSPEDFAEELNRQAELIRHHDLTDGLLVRLTREAMAWLEECLDQAKLTKVLDAATEVALSDERLHKRELMILFDLALISISGLNQLKSWFNRFRDGCLEKFPASHPIIRILQEIAGITEMPVTTARLTLIKRPDEVRGILIPPLTFTYPEFADWLTSVSMIRAAQHREAPLNQTRIIYTAEQINIQKGLIRWSAITGPKDDQLEDGYQAVRRWCSAVRESKGSIPFPDGQLFSAVIFGSNGNSFADCCLPDHRRAGQWYITCTKHEDTIDVHAVDVSGSPHQTYWCPEMAAEVSERLNIGIQLVDGTFPMDPEGRTRILNVIRQQF